MADWTPKPPAPKSSQPSSSQPTTGAASTSTTAPAGSSANSAPSASQNLPTIKLPKGGGAISGIGESFSVRATSGTASASIPIPTASGRSGFGPHLQVAYDSGEGNSPFGFGWGLELPSITRKTSKGLPLYRDAENSDVFILMGSEDLMPVLTRTEGGEWKETVHERVLESGERFAIQLYRPRVEGQFSRIERWTKLQDGDVHWRTITNSNTTAIFGEDRNSRAFDPQEPSHVFSWLVNRTFDDKGHLMVFEYKAENSEGVDLMKGSESRRSELSRTAARYPKRIRYGNLVSTLELDPRNHQDFMFEVVFDYGDHDQINPTPAETQPWSIRKDPFSSYRSGFEMRTYRLCQRMLMFHNFPEEKDVGKDLLVHSVNFSYSNSTGIVAGGNSIATCLSSATSTSHVRTENGYISKSLPPVDYTYSEATISHEIKIVDSSSLENLPVGVSGLYQWQDLDGEGISGVLTRQGGGYFYKPNMGDGKFGPTESLPSVPSLFYTQDKGQQWLDLAGDGHSDLVQFDGTTPGFYKRNPSVRGGWESFKTFRSQPQVSMTDENTTLLDLTGDGLADILMTDDDIFTWFPGWGEAGFGPAHYWRPPLDEDQGPHVLLHDGIDTVHLADMSGDGLNDLVRIRNGEVCYWPNIGYGHFGTKVGMDNSPWFDLADQYSQTRLRLADIDGSGTTDIIYLAASGPKAYLNLSGNGWSHAHHIEDFPRIDEVNDVQVIDFLGRGTACLVWSSQNLGESGQQLRYLDLMSAGKPYLMTSMINNLGNETYLSYSTSTQFYLQDKARGESWVTKLPFPVHVVKSQETIDRISRNRFVTRYRYKHGYYDGVEREFRGFGLVETFDTEDFEMEEPQSRYLADPSNFDPSFKSPPVLTKTWYHTGAYFEDESIMRQFRKEYYKEPGLDVSEFNAISLPESFIPRTIQVGDEEIPYTLTPEEAREAYRSLKGNTLHQEVYSLDGSEQESLPYEVTEGTFGIKMYQPQASNKYAVFLPFNKEEVGFGYERTLYAISGLKMKRADPKVSHSMVLATDQFGNVLSSVSIAYGRRYDDMRSLLSEEDRAKQRTTSVMLTLHNFTNIIDEPDTFLLPVSYETFTFQIGNWPRPRISNFVPLNTLLAVQDIVNSLANGQSDVPFQDYMGATAAPNRPYRRLLAHDRMLFRRNDLEGPLPLGQMESLSLTYQSYSQILTPSLAHYTYVESGKVESDDALATLLEQSCRFTRFDDDQNWWVPSGRNYLSPGTNDSPAQESAYAQKHFYLPLRYRDQYYSDNFNTESSVTYDRYDLLPVETRDALGNRITVGTRSLDPLAPVEPAIDYRLLSPKLIMDSNRNRAATAYDILGNVTASAIMGKPEDNEGDSLAGIEPFLSDAQVDGYLKDPLAHAHSLLGTATTRSVYDVWAYYNSAKAGVDPADRPPVFAALIQRETHVSDLAPNQLPELQQTFAYSDGFGRAIQAKDLTEPDPVTTQTRWVTSSWIVFNNKGSPVRKYEPFFSGSNAYQGETMVGVSSTTLYDPLQRVVATLTPNHTWGKTTFDSWSTESWDHNDTVLSNPTEDPDVGGFFRQLPQSDYLPTWYDARIDGQMGPEQKEAAIKASVHANTPGHMFTDPLGYHIVSISYNKMQRITGGPITTERYISRVHYDISGNSRVAVDTLGRIVQTTDVSMGNSPIHQATMEAGEKWMLNSCTGLPIRAWNSRGFELSWTRDVLERTTESFVQQGDGPKYMVSKMVYGEQMPDAEKHNWRSKMVTSFDESGMGTIDDYDFKGNPLRGHLQYVKNYKDLLDWSTDVPLLQEKYSTSNTYDALNRSVIGILPDGTVIKNEYAKSGQAKRVSAQLQGAEGWTRYLADSEFNARNQPILVKYGNGVQTEYSYDPLTFSMDKLITRRNTRSSGDGDSAQDGSLLQHVKYTYDATLNIVNIHDAAQQTIYFRNQVVKPSNSFTYDSIYRLIEATGREHLGQSNKAKPYGPSNRTQTGLQSPGDGRAMARYTESYFYDAVGNVLTLQHAGSDAAQTSWTREYSYKEPSQIDPSACSNRLSSTSTGSQTQEYRYEGNEGLTGNMTAMAHLPVMRWDYRDQFRASSRQHVSAGDTPETTWYSYSGGGDRARKTTDRYAVAGETPTLKSDRFYQGSFEVYREYGGDGHTTTLERTSIHIEANGHRIAIVELTNDKKQAASAGAAEDIVVVLTRYQHSNQLGSSLLELDSDTQIVSYEEYFPYGSTSYQATRSQTETKKRYRYTGKERDDETGLYYHGSRYYAPWIARWVSADPGGTADGPNLYQYAGGDPIDHSDPTGRAKKGTGSKKGGGKAKVKGGPKPVKKGKIGGAARYGYPIPDNLKGQVEMEHPIPVDYRKKSTGGAYDRAYSAKNHEWTVFVSKKFNDELISIQNNIKNLALKGKITEEEAIKRFRKAYNTVEKRTGEKFNRRAVNQAIKDNIRVVAKAKAEAAATAASQNKPPATAVTDESISKNTPAVQGADHPTPEVEAPKVQAPGPTPATEQSAPAAPATDTPASAPPASAPPAPAEAPAPAPAPVEAPGPPAPPAGAPGAEGGGKLGKVAGGALEAYVVVPQLLDIAADLKHGDKKSADEKTDVLVAGVVADDLLGPLMLPVAFVLTATSPSQLDPATEAKFQKAQEAEDEFAENHPEADAAGGVMLVHTLYRMVVEPAIATKKNWNRLMN
jgi:RHS repeat-associated protein